MSYELCARADAHHSHVAARSAVSRAVSSIPHVVPNGPSDFVMQQGKRACMNIGPALQVAVMPAQAVVDFWQFLA